MTIYNAKTDDELLDDIRATARVIRDASDEIPLVGSMAVDEIRRLESLASALAIYARLLGNRLDVGPSASVEHFRASLESE
jgi:hypothetical protein